MLTPSKQPAPLSVVILAAGQGKRMNSDLPKVLQPLAGRPLLAHVLDCAASLNAAATHVVYGHGGEQVRAAVEKITPRARINWTLQSEQLGTGHALLQAMPTIPDDHQVLVLYGDVPLINRETLSGLIALAGPKRLSLLTVMLADPSGYGRIVRGKNGAVRAIVEQKDASKTQLLIREGNSGILVVPARPLKRWLKRLKSDNAQREYYLTDVIAMAASEKYQVSPLVAPSVEEVLGVNDKVQLAILEAAYRRQRAQALMRAGVTIIDPARIDIRGEVSVGRDVQFDVNVVLEGPIHLGNGVHIGANCVLTDVTVGDGTQLLPNCVVTKARIGRNCQIGPFTRIRPDTELLDDVHLGNFVELKKTRVGHGSKVNHLTYLGDASIGSKVNVGAGTITCNYDGANKWRTEIGDDAFIGSGSMLVAPLKIGDGATIGAGSTITSNPPPQQLTLSRSRQVTMADWRRPKKQPKDS
jgi:bifunctional UDP-N-acetylglucosamine pyrophosphorylase/glucosamine-1-phosphate N-acetyltransferase